jgi:TonB family protein
MMNDNLFIKDRHSFRNQLIPFRFQRITRRQGGGKDAYYTYVEEADDAANKVSRRKRNGMTFPLGLSIAGHVLIAAFLLIMGTGHAPPCLTRQLGQVITVSMVSSTQTQSAAIEKRPLSGGNKPFTEKREVVSAQETMALYDEKKNVLTEMDLSQRQAAVNLMSHASDIHDGKVRDGTRRDSNKSNADGLITNPLPTGARDKENSTGEIADPSSAWPRYKANDQPSYPLFARLRGHEGTVLLSVEILSSGRVGRTMVKTSSGYEVLDHTALAAVKKWIFEPAMQKGIPVAMWVEIPIRFYLNNIND